jgi:hypothetical protein
MNASRPATHEPAERVRSSVTARGVRAIAIACVIAVALASTASLAAASTGPSIVVLTVEGEPARTGLKDELSIQLRGFASVEDNLGSIRRATMIDMLDQASAKAREAGVDFAIWVESGSPASDPIAVVLYLVSDRRAQALVEVVRLAADSDGPDVDRALAIKVREVLRAARSNPEASMASIVTSRPVAIRRPGAAIAPLLALGGSVVPLPARSAQASLVLSAGARLAQVRVPGMWELRATAHLNGATATETAAGRVEVAETAVSVAAVGLGSVGRLRAGGGIALGARRLDAAGTTRLFNSGAAVRWTPIASVGPEVRLGVGGGLELGAVVALELAARGERFALNREVVVDVGRARLVCDFLLVITTR